MDIIKMTKNITSGLYRSVKRFPESIFLSAATAVMLIVISELNLSAGSNVREVLQKVTLVIALGIPLSLSIKLFFERKAGWKLQRLMLMDAAGILILTLYYFLLLKGLNMVSETRYTGISLALYLMFLYIPYLPHRKNYEKYVMKVMNVFFTTVLYSGVLYGGLSAILFTVDKLLGVHVDSKIYYYTWLTVALVFAPAYFLAGLPESNKQFDKESYPKLLKILLLYIVMPLIGAYTVILYAYFIKIIATRQWPQGLVSNLVLWYAVIVAVVLFFINPLEDENKWANIFFKWLPKVILPVLVMMFVSMGIRINVYGMTENRYFVVALGIWATGVMIYFSLSKKVISIVLPVTLSIITIISVLGPLSSYSVSIWSQNSRLTSLLAKNSMITDGKIKASQNISDDDKNEVNRILDYFNNSHSFRDVKYLPQDFKLEDMNKVFGFSYEYQNNAAPNNYFNFMAAPQSGAIEIRGYDYLFDSNMLMDKATGDNDQVDAYYDPESGVVKINYRGIEVYNKDMKYLAQQLIEKHGITEGKGYIPQEEMNFTEENEKLKVKFMTKLISGVRDESLGKTSLNAVEFDILIKIK